jgi:hypothetical protein
MTRVSLPSLGLALCLLPTFASVAACSSAAPNNADLESTSVVVDDRAGDTHVVRTHDARILPVHRMSKAVGADGALASSRPAGTGSSSGPNLVYYGGPVLSSVKVHAVFWGGKVKYTSDLQSFYGAIVDSSYFDWLSEYDTPDQNINHGSYSGSYTDTGSATSKKTVKNEDIQAELSRLIDAGDVPTPDENTLYMFHFAPGVSVSLDDASSCVQFCAFHNTYKHGDKTIYYGVIPDQGGDCARGCGNGSQLENTTASAAHELIEAVTDPGVGLATQLGAPIAWYDDKNGEIADICADQQAPVSGFTVQGEWSNRRGKCIYTDADPAPHKH